MDVRTRADRGMRASDDEVLRLERDRAELATRLDAAEAQGERLRATNREVAGRLVKVMEVVRQMGHALPEDNPASAEPFPSEPRQTPDARGETIPARPSDPDDHALPPRPAR